MRMIVNTNQRPVQPFARRGGKYEKETRYSTKAMIGLIHVHLSHEAGMRIRPSKSILTLLILIRGKPAHGARFA